MRETANFRMVKLARELRGRTQTELGEASQIGQARLSRIEAGRLDPTDMDVQRLARATGLPTTFFTQPSTPAAAPLFRKRAIRSKRKLDGIQARLNVAVLVAQRLLDAGIKLDPPNLFPERGEFPPEEPELAAAALRRDWRLPAGPIVDVTGVIESAGGIVLRSDFGSGDASAALVNLPGDPRLWFLINTREESGDRVRLSLAHELGHAVLHRSLPSIDEGRTEDEAFTFATSLLLPADHFDRLVPFDALTLSEARALKARFGVSMQAIIKAAHQRGRISRQRYTSLFKQLSARRWRTQEPDPIPLERPQIWPEVLEVHRGPHGYSDDDLAAVAHVDATTLGELFPENFRRRGRLRAVGVASSHAM